MSRGLALIVIFSAGPLLIGPNCPPMCDAARNGTKKQIAFNRLYGSFRQCSSEYWLPNFLEAETFLGELQSAVILSFTPQSWARPGQTYSSQLGNDS